MSQGMFAAVSSIRANQTKLNVVANNLANLNTVAFKASDVNFKTVFSQTIKTGTIPSDSVGGSNPMQIGNGVSVGEIIQNFGQGGSLFTGRQGDLQIEGEGFFTIERSDVETGDGGAGFYLTRAGNFNIDGDGNLVTPTANRVLGTRTVNGNDPATVTNVRIPNKLTIWKERNPNAQVVATWIDPFGSTTAPAPTDPLNATPEAEDVTLVNFSISPDGAITGTYSNGDRVTVRTEPGTNEREIYHVTAEGNDFSVSGTGTDGPVVVDYANTLAPEQIQIRMAVCTNPSGLIHEGSNYFTLGPNVGEVSLGIPNQQGRGQLTSGSLESSNVDVAGEFTNMIVAQRGLEAAGKVITTQSQVMQTLINLI